MGKGPATVSNGIANAAASETPPRIPVQPNTATCDQSALPPTCSGSLVAGSSPCANVQISRTTMQAAATAPPPQDQLVAEYSGARRQRSGETECRPR